MYYRYMFVFFNVFFLHLSWCITGTCLCSSMYFFYILVDVLLYRYMFVFFNVFFLHLSWCITGTCLCSSMYFFYILVDVLQVHVCVLQCIFISIFIVLLFIFSADFSAWSRWYGVSLVIVNKTDILYICNT